MLKTKTNTGSTETQPQEQAQEILPLGRANFILMGISALIIIVGFLLMLGSSQDGDTFNPDIYSTRRIVVGPTVAILGFIAMAFAIIYNRRKK